MDQLEELFTQGFSEEEVGKFLTFLVTMTANSDNRIRMVATIRSEFLGNLENSETVLPLLNQGCNYHLGRVFAPGVTRDD